MKPLFIMSLVCSVMSLLAIFGLSATTFVPGTQAERALPLMVVVAGLLFFGWLSLGFWARPRRDASSSLPPPWLKHFLVGFSIVYLLAVFVFVIG